ncbi:Radial spoke head protein 3 [Cladochytrium tenue]|nr:Radial spoke head protein 3 [Cladochytrium tenue]
MLTAPAMPSGGGGRDGGGAGEGDRGSYAFAAQPKTMAPAAGSAPAAEGPTAAAASRKKYRDASSLDGRDDQGKPMWNAQPDPVQVQKQHDLKRRLQARRRQAEQRRLRTPEAVDGRRHMDVQTELYLEELTTRVPEAQRATQTDAFLDRAPSPLYVPRKSGVDAATQVRPGELFDFDREAAPLLEVLVGKTLEQALMEVHEEEELAMLKRHQAAFDARRHAEAAEVQRLEDAERRRTEEKERRLAEQVRQLREKQEAAEKVSARAFAQSYLAGLVPSVFDSLATNGYFYDVVEREVDALFVPWLEQRVAERLGRVSTARAVVDDVIRAAVRTMQARRSEAVQRLEERERQCLQQQQLQQHQQPDEQQQQQQQGEGIAAQPNLDGQQAAEALPGGQKPPPTAGSTDHDEGDD